MAIRFGFSMTAGGMKAGAEAADIATVIAAGKAAGFTGIELSGYGEDGSMSLPLYNAEQTKNLIDEAGLAVCALATGIRLHHADESRWQRSKLSAERAVEMAMFFGAPVVRVLGHVVDRGESRSHVIARIGARLGILAARAHEMSGGKVTVALQTAAASSTPRNSG